MQQTITPTVSPNPNVSVVSRPGLSFQARSVTISTGLNFVSVEGVMGGASLAPGVNAFTWPLESATAQPQITVTTPPPGTAQVGPAPPTVLVFTDQSLTPNPGILSTPQTIAIIPTTQIPNGGSVNVITGLARGVMLAVWGVAPISNTPSVLAQGYDFVGAPNPFLYPTQNIIAPNAVFLSFGQGTFTFWGATRFAGQDGSGNPTLVPVAIFASLPISPVINIQIQNPLSASFYYAGRIFF